MVLYGGLDYPPSSKNEIKRFSSMDDVSSPVRAAGSVFLVQPNPGSMMNLSFQTHPYNPFAVNYNYSRIGQMRFDTSYDNVGKIFFVNLFAGISIRGGIQ
uniref:Uncharacterized protein n=1 Tax=Plectus sambesii TaxID=2011161 RepID=A0A914VYM5_9BILA